MNTPEIISTPDNMPMTDNALLRGDTHIKTAHAINNSPFNSMNRQPGIFAPPSQNEVQVLETPTVKSQKAITNGIINALSPG